MSHYDVIIIHPPAIYDFRRKPIFPGVMAATVELAQYIRVPIGMLSLAEYLDRQGYRVRIDNLGERMVDDANFNVENHLKRLSAAIFAIGLHFQQHTPGALAIAQLCKKLHPHSLVILGGLTATRFHEEILQKHEYVDGVLRGETEQAFSRLLRSYERLGVLAPTPNLTFRTDQGKIEVNPLMPVVRDLDEFEYTRFELLEPRTSIFPLDGLPRWSLEVCRGCLHNCVICGGSAYTYHTYLGRPRPAFRSPPRMIEDIRKLSGQGVKFIGLYQDMRMGGEKYWREFLALLRSKDLDVERLSLALLGPANEEFIREVASSGKQIMLHICPDTGCDTVRRKLGRDYTNEELINTVKLCHKYLLPVTSFFSVGLAGETRESVEQTWELFEKLSSMENLGLARSRFLGLEASAAQGGPIIGPVLLDPGSAAFDDPRKHGYKLLYRNLEEYAEGLAQPSWHRWLNYETDTLDRPAITELVLQSMSFAIEQRAESGFNNKYQADAERRKMRADVVAVNEVDRVLTMADPAERERALRDLRKKTDEFLKRRTGAKDPPTGERGNSA